MKNLIKIEFECLCNLNCDYCFCRGARYQVNEDIMLDKIKEIMRPFPKEDTDFRIEGVGEITLYPKIVSYMNEKVKEGYFVKALSNGVRGDIIEQNLAMDWSISLDGHTEAMNHNRKLRQEQIDRILNMAVRNNFPLQCVYSGQTLEEMNGFIELLKSRGYGGRLHIFPVKLPDRPMEHYLPYEKLIKADFLPSQEYFERWEYIYKHQCRNFTCNFFENGYVYRIMHDEERPRQVKCDCGKFPFEQERKDCYDEKLCDACINHYEYEVYQ